LLAYSYTQIFDPNGETVATGINNSGQIVGSYLGGDPYNEHAFLKDSAGYQTIDFPGASGSVARGINDSGQIVGNFGAHGFLKDSKGYQVIDYPGAHFTSPVGINDSGQIVGNVEFLSSDGVYTTHGFLKDSGGYHLIDYPGTDGYIGPNDIGDNFSQVNGINDGGQIVGYAYIPGAVVDFLKNGDSYQAINYPNGGQPNGINNAGQVVGAFYLNDVSHGFVTSGASYQSIDDPVASGTQAEGINDAGQIVGTTNGGFSFLATPLNDVAIVSAHLENPNLVSFEYSAKGNLDHFTVGLYSSADGTTYDAADPIASQVIVADLSNPSNPGVFNLDSPLTTEPDKPYLLVVADPDNEIIESDETNNVKAIALTDIDLVSAQAESPTSISFAFSTTGNPGPFTVGLYRSVDGKTYDVADSVATPQTITPSLANPQGQGNFALSAPVSSDPTKPYLVVVADPNNIIAESDETNNVQAILTKTDIVVTQVGVENAGLAALYRIDGAPLPAATTAVFYWSKGPNLSSDHVLAADPIVIPAGTSIGSHDDVGVLTQDEKDAPIGTAYLVVMFDPNNTIVETHEDNNLLSTPVTLAPLVELVAKHADGTVVSDVAPLLFKEPYTIALTVTNRDDEPHDFHVTWGGSRGEVSGFTPDFALPLDSDTGPIAPGASVTLTSSPFQYRWDWIPAQNPLTADADLRTKLGLDLADALDKYKDALLGEIETLIEKGVKDVTGVNIFLFSGSFVASTLPVILGEYEDSAASVDLNYSATLSSPDIPTVTTNYQGSLNVPTVKEQNLVESAFLSLVGPDIDETVSPLTTITPLFTYFLQSIKLLLNSSADTAYKLAYDPPDANYTAIAAPAPRDFPVIDAAPDSLLKSFVLTLAKIESFEQAEATSRDRADGAAAAGDFSWESEQLFAAAGFGIQASYLESQLLSLSAQLAQLGIFKNPSTDLSILGMLAGTFLTVAESELSSASQIRTQRLGEPTRDLSSSELQSLTAQRNLIIGELAGVDSLAVRLGNSETFIATVVSAIENTNNIAALQDDLEFGFGSIIILQQSALSNPTSVTGPTIQSFRRLGVHAQRTRLVLTFNEDVDPTAAENHRNYVIVTAGADGRFGTKDDRRIGLKSASYNPVTHSVTLRPNRRLNWHRKFQITVVGTGPTGLSDQLGNLMDGDGDGMPGGDYARRFRHYGLIQEKPAAVPTAAQNRFRSLHPRGPLVTRPSHFHHSAIRR